MVRILQIHFLSAEMSSADNNNNKIIISAVEKETLLHLHIAQNNNYCMTVT